MLGVYGLLRCIFGSDRRNRKGRKKANNAWRDSTATPVQSILDGHDDAIACMACDGAIVVSSCLDSVIKVRARSDVFHFMSRSPDIQHWQLSPGRVARHYCMTIACFRSMFSVMQFFLTYANVFAQVWDLDRNACVSTCMAADPANGPTVPMATAFETPTSPMSPHSHEHEPGSRGQHQTLLAKCVMCQ
jgi:hypothetical protein